MKKLLFGFRQVTNNFSILVYLISIVLSALMFNDPIIISMIFFALLAMALFSKKSSQSYLKFSIIIFITTLIFNLVVNQRGTNIIFQMPFLKVSIESLLNACILAVSFVNLLLAFYIYDALTNVKIIFDLLSHSLRSIAIIFILTVKFIPKIIDIFESTSFLIKFRNKKKQKKLQRQLKLLEIVLNKSIANFMNMSDVLVVKGYGSKKVKRSFHNNKTDYVLLIISLLVIIFNIVMSIFNVGKVNFGSGNMRVEVNENVFVGLINVILIVMPILIGVSQYIWWKWYVSKITVSSTPTAKNFR